MQALPTSYKELNYKTYVAIINKIPSEKPLGLDAAEWSKTIHLATLSVLLGVPEAEVESLRAVKVAELIRTISFLDKPIEPASTSFKVKSLDELSFDEFVTYQALRGDQWNNLGDILFLVLKDADKEAIDRMSIHDVMQVFFCLSKSTRKSLRRLKYSAMRTMIAQKVRETFQSRRN